MRKQHQDQHRYKATTSSFSRCSGQNGTTVGLWYSLAWCPGCKSSAVGYPPRSARSSGPDPWALGLLAARSVRGRDPVAANHEKVQAQPAQERGRQKPDVYGEKPRRRRRPNAWPTRDGQEQGVADERHVLHEVDAHLRGEARLFIPRQQIAGKTKSQDGPPSRAKMPTPLSVHHPLHQPRPHACVLPTGRPASQPHALLEADRHFGAISAPSGP